MKSDKAQITISFKKGRVKVSYKVFSNTKPNGKEICIIPGLNLMFSANNEGEVMKRSTAMVRTYIGYYLKEESFESLVKELNKLGFKAPLHQYTMSQILNKKKRDASFKNSIYNLPDEFVNAKIIENEVLAEI